jgi:hypothetical protein
VSARPDVPRLAEEDLDLLISRSLDGDLSPEEEQQLERLVALDPEAARRKAGIAALVADLKTLPEPATPFALATRVNANVSERGGRPGSLGGRAGFFPAPGFAKFALVILGIVGVSIAVLRPVPKRAAEGPVDVLLYSPSRPASPAPQTLIAEAKPAPAPGKARRQETDALAKEGKSEESATRGIAEKKAVGRLEQASGSEAAASSSASNVVAESAVKSRADRDEGAIAGGAPVQAPVKIAAAAPPAAAARVMSAPISGGWTVSVRGDAARQWALRRAPDNPPPAHGTAVYRVTLDASGRVTELSRVGGGPADPRLDAFVRGMIFQPITPGVEPELRVAAKDGPAAFADFEIGLTPR